MVWRTTSWRWPITTIPNPKKNSYQSHSRSLFPWMIPDDSNRKWRTLPANMSWRPIPELSRNYNSVGSYLVKVRSNIPILTAGDVKIRWFSGRLNSGLCQWKKGIYGDERWMKLTKCNGSPGGAGTGFTEWLWIAPIGVSPDNDLGAHPFRGLRVQVVRRPWLIQRWLPRSSIWFRNTVPMSGLKSPLKTYCPKT